MLEKILSRYPQEQDSLVMVLLDVQAAHGYLPLDALDRVAVELGVPRSRVLSVATFYNAFSLTPRGRYSIRVCLGTACHVRGAARILDTFARELGIEPGQTTADQEFTLEGVRCIGCCGRAPVVEVGERVYGDVTPAGAREILAELREAASEAH